MDTGLDFLTLKTEIGVQAEAETEFSFLNLNP